MDADFLLIHKMKNGDEEAIEVFVKKYYSTIRNYCRLHTYTDCDAEDITQATFEHFFRSFRSYHHVGKTANYLYVIARNLCRDSYKKKRDIVMEALPDKGENPIAVIENKIDIEESSWLNLIIRFLFNKKTSRRFAGSSYSTLFSGFEIKRSSRYYWHRTSSCKI